VGQIGTEPSSLLYDMDFSFPIGYKSSVYINDYETIHYLNERVNELCRNNCDIIITGSQSSVIPYDTGNLSFFPTKQYSFLLGTLPDAVILCINPYDDADYIIRSIKFLESAVDCKVLGLCVFPMSLKDDWTGMYGQKTKITNEKFEAVKNLLSDNADIPVYLLGNESDMEKVTADIETFFECHD
jgi:hypothetical protein